MRKQSSILSKMAASTRRHIEGLDMVSQYWGNARQRGYYDTKGNTLNQSFVLCVLFVGTISRNQFPFMLRVAKKFLLRMTVKGSLDLTSFCEILTCLDE